MLIKVFSAELHPLAKDTFGISTKPAVRCRITNQTFTIPRQTVFPKLFYVKSLRSLGEMAQWVEAVSAALTLWEQRQEACRGLLAQLQVQYPHYPHTHT